MNQADDFGTAMALVPVTRHDFPADFVWGVATSAFQIEGATSEGGRGVSIWDSFCQQPGAIADASDGRIACDHYHRYPEDLALIHALGVRDYRFSFAWPRLQPDGAGAWNESGFAFYDRLIDQALALGLRLHATLYHWDLPQALQAAGGWGNRQTCQRFADYAAEVGARFGDRLTTLATHNEPWVVAELGHGQGVFAPGLKDRRLAMQVAHHLLVSHGMALDRLRALGLKTQLGIVLNLSPIYPMTNDEADREAARRGDGHVLRWYLDALCHGRYPDDVLADLGDDAPQIEPGDSALLTRPIDFLGINYYTRQLVRHDGVYRPQDEGYAVTDMGWEIYPLGLTELLLRLHRDYRLPPLLIAENGAAFADQCINGEVRDDERIAYLQQHIAAVHLARQHGVDVRGYFVWSLLDNFEWASGYSKRFGIVHVDYATLQRTPKASAYWYRDFLGCAARGAVTTPATHQDQPA